MVYPKGKPSFRKGMSIIEEYGDERAKEIREKISKSKKGRPSSFKGLTWEERYGKEKALILRKKDSIAIKNWFKTHKHPFLGKAHPNKGKKQKITDEERERRRDRTRKRNRDPDFIEKMRKSKLGKPNPKCSETKKKLYREGKLVPWNKGMKPWEWIKMPYEEYLKRVEKGAIKRPNKLEQRVLNIINKYKLPFRYVGDGDIWIARRNPDFINYDGGKQIIEVFGDHWHIKKEEQKTIEHYSKYGFKTLVLWEHDIKKLSDEDVVKIIQGG